MTATRKQKLEAMLADDPADQTLRYMLAMELQNEEDHEQSLQLLESLMKDPTPYVPAFLMAGQQLSKLGRSQEAFDAFTSGIEQARIQGNDHAAGEMAEFRSELDGVSPS